MTDVPTYLLTFRFVFSIFKYVTEARRLTIYQQFFLVQSLCVSSCPDTMSGVFSVALPSLLTTLSQLGWTLAPAAWCRRGGDRKWMNAQWQLENWWESQERQEVPYSCEVFLFKKRLDAPDSPHSQRCYWRLNPGGAATCSS